MRSTRGILASERGKMLRHALGRRRPRRSVFAGLRRAAATDTRRPQPGVRCYEQALEAMALPRATTESGYALGLNPGPVDLGHMIGPSPGTLEKSKHDELVDGANISKKKKKKKKMVMLIVINLLSLMPSCSTFRVKKPPSVQKSDELYSLKKGTVIETREGKIGFFTRTRCVDFIVVQINNFCGNQKCQRGLG